MRPSCPSLAFASCSKLAAAVAAAALSLSAGQALALDILVCNDDGFTSANIRALYQRLGQAGHRVVISAPVDNQSGRGGYVSFLAPVPKIAASYVDPYTGATVVPRAVKATYPALAGTAGIGTDPADANIAYVNGSPVMACLYGMDVLAPKVFGGLPQLVISGPNEGNNTGHINVSSGTVNNTYYAINRGLPAIGVSDAVSTSVEFTALSSTSRAWEVADIVTRIVKRLANRQTRTGEALLPAGSGLNVNIPAFSAGTGASLPLVLTQMGQATSYAPAFYEDLGASALGKLYGIPAGYGLAGVSLASAGTTLPSGVVLPTDANASSEGNVIQAGGKVSVSVIRGVPEASTLQVRGVQQRLGGLLN
jgi:5'-nucleotidase